MHEVKTCLHAQGKTLEMQFDPDNKLVLVMRNDEAPSFAIGWRLNGRWCYQSLMWACRGGRKFWFKPLVAFYRYIRKNNVTDHSLRYLAWADHRLKNDGYAIGTASLKKSREFSRKYAQELQREGEIRRVLEALYYEQLATVPAWQGEVVGNGVYVLNQTGIEVGERTSVILFRHIMGRIVVEEYRGIATRPQDHFRTMRRGNTLPPVHLTDDSLTAAELVVKAEAEIRRVMQMADELRRQMSMAA